MTPHRRLALDVLGTTIGLLALAGALVLAVDGVEQWRLVLEGHLGPGEWARRVALRLPDRILMAGPVCAALAATWITASWRHTGRLAALAAAGVSPGRLALATGLAALLATAGATALREPAASAPLASTSDTEGWTELSSPHPPGVDRRLARVAVLGDHTAVGIEVAWLDEGRAVGRLTTPEAHWDGSRWQAETLHAATFGTTAADPMLSLPSPESWRQIASRPGAPSPIRTLLTAPTSPARDAWLAERLTMPLASLLLAMLAFCWVSRDPRLGPPGVIALAIGWRVVQAGLVSATARGTWPVSATLTVPLLVLGMATTYALWRTRYSTTT